jgi:transcriptional regulator GlxA family with amidase domain
MTCEEVAERSGFYDAAHFSRVFTRLMREPPSQFRRQARGEK